MCRDRGLLAIQDVIHHIVNLAPLSRLLQRMLIIRRTPREQLDGCCTHRPDVALRCHWHCLVVYLRNALWCHPTGRSNAIDKLLIVVLALALLTCRYAKVDQLYHAIFRVHNIGSLNVAVDNILLVQ